MLYAIITIIILFVLFITYCLLRISSPLDRAQDDADQIRYLDEYRKKH